MIVHVVDIGGIVDHHCLKLLLTLVELLTITVYKTIVDFGGVVDHHCL